MTVIEQVMFFAACQECDWQSVLRSEAAIVEGMERTHRAHEHSEQEFLSHYAADVTVPQPSTPYPDCPIHPHSWVDCPGSRREDHDPSRREHRPSEPHVHEFKLRYVCDCGEHSTGLAKGAGRE